MSKSNAFFLGIEVCRIRAKAGKLEALPAETNYRKQCHLDNNTFIG